MRIYLRILALCFLIYNSANLPAQSPLISAAGIVNAASQDRGGFITAGEIVSIFGKNLAPETKSADTPNLPYSLAGSSVLVNGLAAPLFYVSPGQINFQVPSLFTTSGPAPPANKLVVISSLGSSIPITIPAVGDILGIFTQDSSGCGLGSIQNVAADSSVSLNSQTASAAPGDFITLYGTGIGAVYDPPPDGMPASDSPLPRYNGTPSVQFGLPGFSRAIGSSTYAGRAPGLIGVDQVNVQIPQDAPEGCDVPLSMTAHSSSTQAVTLSIRKDRGTCQTAAPAQIGFLHWQRTTTPSQDAAVPIVTDTFTGELLEAPKNMLTLLPADQVDTPARIRADPPARACAITGVRALDAGQLSLTVDGKQLSVSPDLASRQSYQAILAPGAVQPGPIQVQSAGGADVGAFQSTLSIPPAIKITTSLVPGTSFSIGQPLRIAWTGGDANSLVVLLIDQPVGDSAFIEIHNRVSALGNAGEVILQTVQTGQTPPRLAGVIPGDNVTITVIVIPASGKGASFSAPGLPIGHLNWEYRYIFKGLKII